jgi:hypothetical protein
VLSWQSLDSDPSSRAIAASIPSTANNGSLSRRTKPQSKPPDPAINPTTCKGRDSVIRRSCLYCIGVRCHGYFSTMLWPKMKPISPMARG